MGVTKIDGRTVGDGVSEGVVGCERSRRLSRQTQVSQGWKRGRMFS
jgi:hypothetical protein